MFVPIYGITPSAHLEATGTYCAGAHSTPGLPAADPSPRTGRHRELNPGPSNPQADALLTELTDGRVGNEGGNTVTLDAHSLPRCHVW